MATWWGSLGPFNSFSKKLITSSSQTTLFDQNSHQTKERKRPEWPGRLKILTGKPVLGREPRIPGMRPLGQHLRRRAVTIGMGFPALAPSKTADSRATVTRSVGRHYCACVE